MAGCAAIAAVTLALCALWYALAIDRREAAEDRRLQLAAASVAALADEFLDTALLRLTLNSEAGADADDLQIVHAAGPQPDPRLPADIRAAAVGPGADRVAKLSAPYLLDGRWRIALVAPAAADGRAAVIPVERMGKAIDAAAAAAGVDVVVTSVDGRIWWTAPLDSTAVGLPVATAPDAGDDRLAQWAADGPTGHWSLPAFGLNFHVRPSGGGAPPAIDPTDGVLILLAGVTGAVGCLLLARRRPAVPAMRPAAAAANGPAPAAVANGLPHPLGVAPALLYVAAGGRIRIAQSGGFGFDDAELNLPVRDFAQHVAAGQRAAFGDFLEGSIGAAAAPVWLSWTGSGDPRELLHLPCSRDDAAPIRAGLLVEAEPLRAAWRHLQTATQEARAANVRKSRFLARLSHELRTPLNAIIGFAELMEKETFGPIGTPRYKDYLADIAASGHHLHDLINDIIDISRVETGELDLSESVLSIQAELQACIRLIHERLEASNLGFEFATQDALPNLRADPLRFRQVMLNLLSNAIKFTPPGGRVTLSVDVDAAGALVIAVADTGIGMTESGVRRAMEPFGRLTDEHYGPIEGTGLGLPIARGLVTLHGGTLDIASAPGVGTTVYVRFPAERLVRTP